MYPQFLGGSVFENVYFNVRIIENVYLGTLSVNEIQLLFGEQNDSALGIDATVPTFDGSS